MNRLLNQIKSKLFLIYWEILLLVIVLALSLLESFITSIAKNYFAIPPVYFYYVVPLVLSVISLLFLLIILLRNERKGKLNFNSLLKRLRLKRVSIKGMGISFLLLLFTLVTIGISRIVLVGVFGFQDSTSIRSVPEGITKQDIDYLVLLIIVFGTLTGTLLEELLWRGYLLPLQEKKTGKFGVYFNGLLWSISHLFVYNPAIIIIASLGFSYVAYSTKNTSITLIAHLLLNGLVLMRLVYHYIL